MDLEAVEETPVEETSDEGQEVGTPEEEESSDEGTGIVAKPDAPPRESFEQATFTCTVNGKDVEVSGKKLIEAYQRGESGAERFREASELRKQVEQQETKLRQVAQELQTPEGFYQLLLAMKNDPIEFLSGVAKLAQEEAKLTPDQRELRELRGQKARTEAERQRQEKAAAAAAEAAQVEATVEAYEEAFEEEFDTLGIPDDDDIRDELLTLVGRAGSQAMANGEDPEIGDLVKGVWEKYRAKHAKLAPKTTAPSQKIPGTRPATKPNAPKTAPASNKRPVYSAGMTFEEILKLG